MCKHTLRLAGIVNDSITDGPGLRAAVFVQGCPRRCEGCHNPQALEFDGGTVRNVDEVWTAISRNPLLSGVTFSGGEPFCQAGALAALARHAKEAGLEVAAYTGYTFEELLQNDDPDVHALLELCDVVVDGPFILARRNLLLKFRGSDNQRILNVQQSLAEGRAVLEQSARWNG